MGGANSLPEAMNRRPHRRSRDAVLRRVPKPPREPEPPAWSGRGRPRRPGWTVRAPRSCGRSRPGSRRGTGTPQPAGRGPAARIDAEADLRPPVASATRVAVQVHCRVGILDSHSSAPSVTNSLSSSAAAAGSIVIMASCHGSASFGSGTSRAASATTGVDQLPQPTGSRTSQPTAGPECPRQAPPPARFPRDHRSPEAAAAGRIPRSGSGDRRVDGRRDHFD